MKTEKLIHIWLMSTFLLVGAIGSFTHVSQPDTAKFVSMGLSMYWLALVFFTEYIGSNLNEDRTPNTELGLLGLVLACIWVVILLFCLMIGILTDKYTIGPEMSTIADFCARGSLILLAVNLILLSFKSRNPAVEQLSEEQRTDETWPEEKPKNH